MTYSLLLFWLVAVFCVLLASAEKSGFGSGIGGLATPLLTLATNDPVAAVGILLPILIATDWIAMYVWWGKGSWRNYWLIAPGAALGIALASLALWFLLAWHGDPALYRLVFKQVIGWMALLFVVYRLAQGWLAAHAGRFHPQPWHGWLAGLFAGIASTFAHAGGPPVVIFLLPQHLGRQLFVGTTVALFATINLLKLGPYYLLGLIHPGNLKISLMLMPLIPLGVLFGTWANRHIHEELFLKVTYVGLTVIGLGYVGGYL